VPDHRIVSLLPSATEIVCAVGANDELVGVSHECDFPEQVRGRRVLTRPRIALGGSSRAIDAAVRDVIANALSIYVVDDAALAALAPDVIVTQDLCEVCAVSLDDVERAVARLARRDVRIVSLRPTRLGDVLDDIGRVAAAIGRSDAGDAVRAALQARIAAIAARAAGIAATTEAMINPRPRVVSLEWIEPLMIGGTWMPELIALAGGVAMGAEAGAPAPTVTTEALRALAPDVVVVKPCGFSLARALEERDIIERDVIAAVPAARVYVTDGNAFFNRPGPRLVESLEIMAACVHPEAFGELGARHREAICRLA
jgi:iron complex transport system substrate-binding protein